jgi:transposase-like protein
MACQAVLTGAPWQRCQFHLAQNAINHAPNQAIRKRIGAELRQVWNAPGLECAMETLGRLVESYREHAPRLAAWLEDNVPQGLSVFALPEHRRRRMRTSNSMERAVQQEVKRRTQKVRVFPNEASLERLVNAVLIEIDDKWASTDRAYIIWETKDD